jgi:LuxR family transcriptional regulator, maltose regulon positive regulatory protein
VLFEGHETSDARAIPRPGRAQQPVPRSMLFERLSAAGPTGVVLVCGAPGSGKSVLMRSWAAAHLPAGRVAWVSIERGEGDAQSFWLKMIDALAEVVNSVERPGPSPSFRGDMVVERVLSQLGSIEAPVVLVIDDVHELKSAEALAWVELFLARLPSQLLVVLVSREEPGLGLHRLRLAGELTELRDADLRFSLQETRALLHTAGVQLSDTGVALLHERTEGWVAGLRLAAISLARHPDSERFVREFSGSERNVASYLMAEVLERQPAEVRELLLRTSVLERVSGALADYLTGNFGSERIFQRLEDANAFVSSLDVGRSWFRYHHLFAELLRLELRRTSPAIVGSLHRAAARWYEQHGYIVEAIRHAQAADDWAGASRLLADNYLDLTFDGRVATVGQLLGAFPDGATASDPELALVCAVARLLAGKPTESAAYLELAKGRADAVPADRKRRFDMRLTEMQVVVARWLGDLETAAESMRAMEEALAALPADQRAQSDEHRAVALQNLGIAELWGSQTDDARCHLEEALALTRRVGRPWLEIACLGHLGIAGPWTGMPLAEGLKQSERAVQIAEAGGWDEDPVVVTGLATGAIWLLWLGRFDEAEQWLERSQRVLRPDGEPGIELVLHHARGLLRLVQGRLEQALDAFGAAERMQSLLRDEHPFSPRTRARVLQTRARMGHLAAVAAALADLSPEERDAPPMRIVAAAIELAEGAPGQAVEVLAPAIEASAHAAHLRFAVAEAQCLDAVAREQLGDRSGAEVSLERALELAEPEGIVLPFALVPARALLNRIPRHRTAHGGFLRTILDVLAGSSAPGRAAPARLRDELSEAELRVVRYLSSNLKAPELAAELCVSANTVRTHVRHIYAKLDAHDRNEAVARARELGLLAPSARYR